MKAVFLSLRKKLVEVSRQVCKDAALTPTLRVSSPHSLLKPPRFFKGLICVLWSIYIYKQTPGHYLCMLLPSRSIIHSASSPEGTRQAWPWELAPFQDFLFAGRERGGRRDNEKYCYSTFDSTNINLSYSAAEQDALFALPRLYLNVFRILFRAAWKETLSRGVGDSLLSFLSCLLLAQHRGVYTYC